jgi:hypothetical protein
MPVSKDYLDGVPKMTDFNSMFSTRLEAQFASTELSFVMHCMILIGCTRALYAPPIADVLWDHLLSDGDPTGFVKSCKHIHSKPTNASSFLAHLAAQGEHRENPELSKAVSDLVSDMDGFVREGVLSEGGGFNHPQDKRFAHKLISIVTGLTRPDTTIFDRSKCTAALDSQKLHSYALEAVKIARFVRLNPQNRTD